MVADFTGGGDGDDLVVVVAVGDEHRHRDRLEIIGEVGLRERRAAVVRALELDLHPLAPELVALALGDGRPFAVGAEERGRKVLVELRADLMTASGQIS